MDGEEAPVVRQAAMSDNEVVVMDGEEAPVVRQGQWTAEACFCPPGSDAPLPSLTQRPSTRAAQSLPFLLSQQQQ